MKYYCYVLMAICYYSNLYGLAKINNDGAYLSGLCLFVQHMHEDYTTFDYSIN